MDKRFFLGRFIRLIVLVVGVERREVKAGQSLGSDVKTISLLHSPLPYSSTYILSSGFTVLASSILISHFLSSYLWPLSNNHLSINPHSPHLPHAPMGLFFHNSLCLLCFQLTSPPWFSCILTSTSLQRG